MTRIIDGDTFVAGSERIRLYGIDCPEKGEPLSDQATQFTKDLIAGKQVIIEKTGTDRYARTVAIVYIDGKCLNEELLKSGNAWIFDRYCKSDICKEWRTLEHLAKTSNQGIWN